MIEITAGGQIFTSEFESVDDVNLSIRLLDTPLPRALAATPYERFRDEIFFAAALLILAIAAVLSRIDGRPPEKM